MLYPCSVIERENTYQTIKRMKTSSDWDFCLAHFQKAWTLDFYFRLYELVLTYYPERKYGYAKEMARNDLIISKLGGYSQTLQNPDVIEPAAIHKAVFLMEQPWQL